MNHPPPPLTETANAAERVPLFGTWRPAYVIVLVVLVLNVVLLYACTRLLS